MAISSQSIKHQYKDPVSPWDLNIFATVLQTKQQQFNQGAAALQAKVDGFSSLDVLADTDKEYLNSKINETTAGINKLGGADLSDISVLSQLSGYVSNIGKDERIINAVTDTKKIRMLQSGRAQINKDFNEGKKGVFRSDANEAVENKAVESYLSGKQQDPTVRYTGPINPISYSNYHKTLHDAVNDIKANSVPVFSPTKNAYMYVLKTGETVTEDRVWQVASASLTEEDRGQMSRDASYRYRNATDEQILSEYNSSNLRQIDRLNREIEQADIVYGLEAPLAKERLTKQKDQYVTEVEKRKLDMQKALTLNREAAVGQLFTNRYYEGLATKYAYRKENMKVVFDQGQMHVDNLKQKQVQFDARLRFDSQKEKTDQFNEDRDFYQRERKLQHDITQDGKKVETATPDSTSSFIDNAFSEDKKDNSIDILKSDNASLKEAKTAINAGFFDKYARLYDVDNKLGYFTQVNGHAIPTEKFKLAQKELYQASIDIANGRPTRLTSLPKEFVEHQEKIRAFDLQQTANQEMIDLIRSRALDNTYATIKSTTKLTSQEWENYKKAKVFYDSLPTKEISTYEPSIGTDVGTSYSELKMKIADESNLTKKEQETIALYKKYKDIVDPVYKKEVEKVEKDKSLRLSPLGITFSTKEAKNTGLMRAIVSQNRGYYVLNSQGGIESNPEDNTTVIPYNSFMPVSKVKHNLNGVNQNFVVGDMEVGTGNDKETKRVYIPIDDETAKSIDAFAASPASYINRALDTSPSHYIQDKSYGIPVGGRITNIVDFRVVKADEGDYRLSIKQPFDENGNALSEPIWVMHPRQFESGHIAYQLGKELAPVYQQRYEESKQKGKKLPFREFVRNQLN